MEYARMNADTIHALREPLARATQAQGLITRGEAEVRDMRRVRDLAIFDLRGTHTQRAIAALLGITCAAVNKIVQRERARVEAGRPDPTGGS